MIGRLLLAVLLACSLLAQGTLTYRQFREFLESSLERQLRDREIAKYLKTTQVKFRISDALIEEFVGLGAGPKTIDALRLLQSSSQGYPLPVLQSAAPEGPVQPPPPSEPEQRRLIEAARASSLAYTDRLPDFVCLQVTRRYVDPTGLELQWFKQDDIKTRVAYVEGREDYELVSVNNQPAIGRDASQLGGATSTGEFGTMLAELFDPATGANFTWARHSLLRGRGVYVFNLRVSQPRSSWSVSYRAADEGPSDRIITGYKGLIYIDKETERVLRIYMEALDLPPSFPIREAQTRLDYDFTDISGRQFLLPLKARNRLRTGKFLSKNDVEFRLYRKFEAEAILSFGDVENLEPLPDDPQPGEDEPESPK